MGAGAMGVKVPETQVGISTFTAPHGYVDLFAQRVRPNPVLAPRYVYETKTARWQQQWPGLLIEPWPSWLDGTTSVNRPD